MWSRLCGPLLVNLRLPSHNVNIGEGILCEPCRPPGKLCGLVTLWHYLLHSLASQIQRETIVLFL